MPNSHWWFLAEKLARNHGGGSKPRSPRIVWFLSDFSYEIGCITEKSYHLRNHSMQALYLTIGWSWHQFQQRCASRPTLHANSETFPRSTVQSLRGDCSNQNFYHHQQTTLMTSVSSSPALSPEIWTGLLPWRSKPITRWLSPESHQG